MFAGLMAGDGSGRDLLEAGRVVTAFACLSGKCPANPASAAPLWLSWDLQQKANPAPATLPTRGGCTWGKEVQGRGAVGIYIWKVK